MKALFVFLFTLSFLTLTELDVIATALQSGDTNTLATYFDGQVEMSVLDEEDLYDQATAKQVLATFFSKNKPVAFDQVHKGKSQGKNSVYCIGNLTTSSKTFRVYVYLKVEGKKHVIQELRIDEE